MVQRPRLAARLNEGLRQGHGFGRRLTLVSAPAGFGKTTLLSQWLAGGGLRAAWLSLDEGDNELPRFLAYLAAALRTVSADIGAGVMGALQASPPPVEAVLTALINDSAAVVEPFVLVLDDYHLLDAKPVEKAVTFLLDHLPRQMHLVIATREDPNLPLARLRARGELAELRATDLRFTLEEAAGFLNRAMGLELSTEEVAALENRTEGWIAGLQLAALALQGLTEYGHEDAAGFIQSFTGSHRFVLDYLLEEVLHQQPESIQTFLLRTAILERLCGPLCEAVLGDDFEAGQETLEYLERANLFILPLDDQRRWYRYHHLFGDLLRQRLPRSLEGTGKSAGELHLRASEWYEENGLEIEAFQHAAAAGDIERTARLLAGKGMPLHFRGAVGPVLGWLEGLPKAELDARPVLWVMYGSALSMAGQLSEVEPRLQAAERALEAALQGEESDAQGRNLIGHIAAIRALLAAAQGEVETIISQSERALEYLHPDNLAVRTATIWKLGIAYHMQGKRAEAREAYAEARAISQASGNLIVYLSASIGLGQIQEKENELFEAAETYRRVLELAGDTPQTASGEAHLGLGRISYEWNDLEAARRHAQQGLALERLVEGMDTAAACRALLARLELARGDAAGAAALLAEPGDPARRYTVNLPQVTSTAVAAALQQGDLAAASILAEESNLPLCLARVRLAQGDPAAALQALEPYHREMEARGWADEKLKALVLQAVALEAQGEREPALQALEQALTLAEPGGFVRLFLEEGAPLRALLAEAARRGTRADYAGRLLAAWQAEMKKKEDSNERPPAQALIEPLSDRELEVLRLVAQGLSNREIGERLFLAVPTVKGHNQRIYAKLQVQRRTEAVARARELGLL